MYSRLVTNVSISGAAFFAVSVVGLLIVPVLIGTYGLVGFGLIAIGRLFLPATALSVLDLGYGENATHAVATSRVTDDWAGCVRSLGLNVVIACALGLAAGIILFVLASWIPVWCRVPEEHQGEITEVLRVTAVLLPVLLCSLIAEGVLKGFEYFGSQRIVEVVSTLAYACGALWSVSNGLDFRWVSYALLWSLLLRAGLAAGLALWALRPVWDGMAWWTSDERVEFVKRVRVLFPSKMIGVVQGHSSSFFVTFLFGPVALGVLDALSRLPRFTKSVLSLLSSTVQPVAVQLEQLTDDLGLLRLGRLGLILVAYIAAPVLGLAVAFSEPLLRLWLGPDISPLWGWQAAYFIVPTLGALVSFGSSALFGRMSVLAELNRISFINVVIIVVVGLALSPWLRERAFIASQVAAAMVSMPWHLVVISREIGLNRTTFITITLTYLIALVLALPFVMFVHHIETPVQLVSAMLAWMIACWTICLYLAIPALLRSHAFSVISMMFRNRL